MIVFCAHSWPNFSTNFLRLFVAASLIAKTNPKKQNKIFKEIYSVQFYNGNKK